MIFKHYSEKMWFKCGIYADIVFVLYFDVSTLYTLPLLKKRTWEKK